MWSLIPPIQSLKLFDLVARNRSMTRAAAEAGISQSAVSQSVQQLERFVQAALLDRSSRPMRLTEEGEAFHRLSTDVLSRLAAAVEDMRRSGNADNDTVTVSCNLGFATYWLMPRLNYFSAEYPEIAVNVMAAYDHDAGFQSGADVVIRFGGGNWPDGGWRLLFEETIGPVCSPDYLSRIGPITEPAQLVECTIIHVGLTDPSWHGWEQYFDGIGHGVTALSGGLRFSNYVQAVQAALSGDGVMLGWRSVVGDFVEAKQLTLAMDAPLPLDQGYFLKTAPTLDESDQRNVFLEWLHKQAGTTPVL